MLADTIAGGVSVVMLSQY